VRHDAADFELAPTYGERVCIAYKNEKASVSVVGSKAGRSSAKAPNKALICNNAV
jgi:hypothetical protein